MPLRAFPTGSGGVGFGGNLAGGGAAVVGGRGNNRAGGFHSTVGGGSATVPGLQRQRRSLIPVPAFRQLP